jgi:hypothetical protein
LGLPEQAKPHLEHWRSRIQPQASGVRQESFPSPRSWCWLDDWKKTEKIFFEIRVMKKKSSRKNKI